jgi:ubiquinone/menaquinone biosynthesis C-methylase UbiE
MEAPGKPERLVLVRNAARILSRRLRRKGIVAGAARPSRSARNEEKMSERTAPTKQTIERLFDASAGAYDRAGPSVFARFGARLAEQVPLMRGARVLDVATGAGAALLPIARRLGPHGHVTGIDLSAGMLREADRAARAEGLANVELRKMDAERLEFPDQTFDAVLCAHAIFLFPDQEVALREMRRVTKSGGYVGVSIFGNTPPAFAPAWAILVERLTAYGVGARVPNPLAYYTPEEMEALLGRCGFRSIGTRTEASDIVYSSGQEWWDFLLTMAPRPAILGMDDTTRARFREEYLGTLRPTFRGDGLHLPVSMVYATAQR